MVNLVVENRNERIKPLVIHQGAKVRIQHGHGADHHVLRIKLAVPAATLADVKSRQELLHLPRHLPDQALRRGDVEKAGLGIALLDDGCRAREGHGLAAANGDLVEANACLEPVENALALVHVQLMLAGYTVRAHVVNLNVGKRVFQQMIEADLETFQFSQPDQFLLAPAQNLTCGGIQPRQRVEVTVPAFLPLADLVALVAQREEITGGAKFEMLGENVEFTRLAGDDDVGGILVEDDHWHPSGAFSRAR